MASTNLYSDIYIADASGANRVFMDIRPSPDPILMRTREYDKIEWTVTFIEDSTSDLLWTKYLTFPYVEVSLDNGVTKYLCRWEAEGMERRYESKHSQTVTFRFIIVNLRTSAVTISDADGANPVVLDYNPYPFPEPVQRKNGLSVIRFNSLYITRAKADLLKAKYPSDVRLLLVSGGSTYLCRFDSLEITPMDANNLTLSASFTVLQVVAASAGSKILINGNRLDVDPFPFPFIVQEKTVSSVKCLPTSSASGRTVHFDAGVHISDGTIDFTVDYLRQATRATLLTAYRARNPVTISIDNGTTTYNAVFSRYREIVEGDHSVRVEMGFKIIS